MAYDFNFLTGIPRGPESFQGYQGAGELGIETGTSLDARNAYNAQIASIKQQAGDSWAEAVKRGYIGDNGQLLNIPHYGPAGDTPKGTSWVPVGTGPSPTAALWGKPVNSYDDPVYGRLAQYINPQKQKDPYFDLGRALTIGLVTGGIGSFAAPAVGSMFGLGAGANPTIAALLKMIPSLAMGGGSNIGSRLGSVFGSATGVPGGNMLGSIIGGQLDQRH